MAKPGNTGIRRLINATRFSWQGFRAAYRHEEAFRQESWLALILVPLGLWLGEGGVEKFLLAGTPILLMLVEILNSALEAVVDRFGDEWNELSGRAKDMGSSAVLLAIVLLIGCWTLLLW